MSGLYNVVFGMNVATVLLAPMLTEERPESYFPRFRDCYEEDGNIVVYTRVGGGNRFENHGDPDYDCGESKLYELPTFVETYDDKFDSTYGYYVFGVPDEWRDDFDRVMGGRLGELSDAYVERIAKCYDADVGELKDALARAEVDPDAMRSKPDWGGFLAALNEAVAQ